MNEKTVQIGGKSITVRELKTRHLKEIFNLPENDLLGPVLLVLSGSANLSAEDLDEMTGIELKQLADAVKEVNSPFLEMLKTMNSADLAEGLSRIVDGIFYVPFLRSSAPDTDPPSGDTAIASS